MPTVLSRSIPSPKMRPGPVMQVPKHKKPKSVRLRKSPKTLNTIRTSSTKTKTADINHTARSMATKSLPLIRKSVKTSDYTVQTVPMVSGRSIFSRHSLRNSRLFQTKQAIASKPPVNWPESLKNNNVYVITIRNDRWLHFTARIGPWAPHFRRFAGTNGRTLNPRTWKHNGKLEHPSMKRGRIGCYDSHVRVWETIKRSGVDYALVFEDDADIHYSAHQVQRIENALKQIQGKPWDLILLGHYNDRRYDSKRGIAGGLPRATRWQPMHAYLISKSGVQKVLKSAWPIKHALDVYVGTLLGKGFNMYRMEPRLCGQLSMGHDTEAIR